MTSPDSFKFYCPTCSQKLSAIEEDVGTNADCPACTRSLIVPSRANAAETAKAKAEAEAAKAAKAEAEAAKAEAARAKAEAAKAEAEAAKAEAEAAKAEAAKAKAAKAKAEAVKAKAEALKAEAEKAELEYQEDDSKVSKLAQALQSTHPSHLRSLISGNHNSYKKVDHCVIEALSEPMIDRCKQVMDLCDIKIPELDPSQSMAMRRVVFGIIVLHAIIGKYLERRDVIHELTTIAFSELWEDRHDIAYQFAEDVLLSMPDTKTPIDEQDAFTSSLLTAGLSLKGFLLTDSNHELIKLLMLEMLKRAKT